MFKLFKSRQRFRATSRKPYHVSAGCVVVDTLRGDANVVALFQKDGWFSLPKGGLENDETLEQCAVRETEEETNLAVELIDYIGHDSYQLELPGGQPVNKVVHYFLARPKPKTEPSALRPGDNYVRAEWASLHKVIATVNQKRMGRTDLLRRVEALIKSGYYAK